MSALISIRINDQLLQTMKSNANFLHMSQTDYIRTAIEYMNQITRKEQRVERLKNASLRVRQESMKINAEFDEIEHDPES